MKAYYLEHDLYPATYNFRDEAVGASGTDIDFVDAESGDDSTYSAVIIATEDGHKKVVKFSCAGDNGKYARWDHDYDDQTADGTTVEFIFKYMDNGVGYHYFYVQGVGNFTLMYFIFNSNDNKLYYYYGDGVGGTMSSSVAATPDTWHHVRVSFDFTNDHYDIYLNGNLEGNDKPFYNDVLDTGITKTRIIFNTFGGSNSGEAYLDAYGESWDANYEIGDNREVDWHEQYNKEEITDIVAYPTIVPRLDAYWIGSITVRDFEGSLFSSWTDRDFNKILIEDNSSNVLFRGFLTKKTFTKNSMVLSIAGIGILLDWQPFGSDGYVNYVLAEGLVKAPISADSVLQVKDADGADFTWAVDWWIKEGKDLGLLIADKTAVNTRTWDSSAIAQSGGSVIAGNNASTLTFNDSDSYKVRDSSYPNLDLKITPEIDGAAIDDTDYLKSIEIQYSFRLAVNAQQAWVRATARLQILKDTTWVTIASVYGEKYNGTYWTSWVFGVPIDVDGGNGNQRVIEGADSTLQKYFNKTGATYTSLKGLRFILTGQGQSGGSAEIHVDYLKVVVGYKSDDVSPIMEQITDSAATSITCSNVSAWDETGVVENDGFKIGQNTRVIVKDIASQAGINIFCGTPTYVATLIPDQNGTNNDWTSSGYARVVTIGDASAIHAIEADNLEYEEFGFPNDVNLQTNETVTEIKVYSYAKVAGAIAAFTVDVYYNGSWQGSQGVDAGAGYAWENNTFTIAGGTVDPDDLQVRYKALIVGADGHCYVDGCYVKVTVKYAYAFERYTARKYIGAYCMEPIRAICKLEGAHWYEDYINDMIVLLKLGAFIDSGVDLTEADYGHDWEYEDDCNQIRSFYVFGNAEDEIFAKTVDESVDGYLSRQIIDETISTTADAQEIADTQLALLNSKRPSIKLSLNGVNANLQLGTTVGLTMVRPTVADTDYIIRKIERSKFGGGIKTIIYCGLGESPIGEKIGKIIRDNAFRSHKALRDRLMSP